MAASSHEQQGQKADQWSSKKYAASASFVPKLATVLLEYLNPQPTDRILDVGCGDGKFTSNFIDRVAEVYGIDASPQFVREANEVFGSEKVRFKMVDCRFIAGDRESVQGGWDKVVSNAALHWILRDPSTRQSTIQDIYKSLKPGGMFAFEFGGAGNVPEMTAATIAALKHHGFSVAEAREAIPWFFPDTTWMTNTLEGCGFKVEKCELVYRPTKLDQKSEDGQGGGLEGWARLMLGVVLDEVERKQGKQEKEEVLKEICDACDLVCNREDGGDGGYWLNYVRLRGVAIKP